MTTITPIQFSASRPPRPLRKIILTAVVGVSSFGTMLYSGEQAMKNGGNWPIAAIGSGVVAGIAWSRLKRQLSPPSK